MNFELSDDQKLLKKTVADFARKDSPVARFRRLRADPLGYEKSVWRKMGELGWLAVPYSEDQGGFGGSFVDVSLILEELGRTLVPEPYLASVVLGGTPLARLGTQEQVSRWLEPMINGKTSLALAYAERGERYALDRVNTTATADGQGYVLHGEKVFVLNGHGADAIVVSAKSGKGVSLFVVNAGSPGVTRQTIKTIDGGKGALLGLNRVRVEKDQLLGDEGGALPTLEWTIDRGAAAACAEGTGLMAQVLKITRDYLCTREQFEAKIGTFQALQHRAVDMFVETEISKSTSILAAIAADGEDRWERASAISAAKVQLALGGRFVTQQAIQLHGGIGITDEADVGLYFKRMHLLNTLFGDEQYHLERYAALPTFAAGSEARAADR
jgi:alkylation response protein AidB-like acyl-CoA dehydrogenase